MTETKDELFLLDIPTNRRAQKWTVREQVGRMLWALAHPFFALSPRPLWGWRRWMLRRFGAEIASDVQVYPSVRIAMPWNLRIGGSTGIGDRVTLYALGPIRVGNAATISQGAHLCAGTHDYRRADLPLIKGAIVIGSGAWICADAFIGPSVTVGEGAILGARGVAMKDIEPWAIVAGNPAKRIGTRRIDSNEGAGRDDWLCHGHGTPD